MPASNQTAMRLPAAPVWVGLGVLFFFIALRRIDPYDIWFLLLAGQYALDHLAVPRTDFFLYDGGGLPQIFGGWGYGALMELARRAGGIIGISLAHAALWAGVFLAGCAAIRARCGRRCRNAFSAPELAGLLLAFLAVYPAIIDRTHFRPEVTAYLVWMLGLLLFERGRRDGDMKPALLLYPLLVWLEAWLHTAGPALLILPGAYLAEQLLVLRRRERLAVTVIARRLWPWGFSLLAAIILPVFNPNGLAQVYAHLAALLLTLRGGFVPGSAFSDAQYVNIEYLPFWRHPDLLAVSLITIALWLAIVGLSRRRLLDLALTLPFAVAAIMHVRGFGLWGMSLFAPCAAVFLALAEKAVSRARTREIAEALAVGCGGMAVFGVLFYALLHDALKLPTSAVPFADAVAVIREAYPEGGNVFTDYQLGAVAAWSLGPAYKVGIGAHLMTFNPEIERHYMTVLKRLPGWEAELARYNIIAMMMPATQTYNGRMMELAEFITHDARWRLAHGEDDALVFLRRKPEEAAPDAAARLGALRQFWRNVCKRSDAIYQARGFAYAAQNKRRCAEMLDVIARVPADASGLDAVLKRAEALRGTP